jgi:hypothetical protein
MHGVKALNATYMKIAMFGSGYVSLVSGAYFAYFGEAHQSWV